MPRPNQNLTKAEAAAERAIAARHGFTASTGPHAGQGSALLLRLAIVSGEVATVLLNDDERRHVVAWLAAQAKTLESSDYLLSETVKSLARQLAPGEENNDGSV